MLMRMLPACRLVWFIVFGNSRKHYRRAVRKFSDKRRIGFFGST